MKTFLKNFTILFLFIVFTKVVTGTIKGVVHVTTCPFTDKECF